MGYIDARTGHLVCPTMTRDIREACRVPLPAIVVSSLTAQGGDLAMEALGSKRRAVTRFEKGSTMRATLLIIAAMLAVAAAACAAKDATVGASPRKEAPFLEDAPTIDGDLAEWKERAFTDGVWDIHRLRHEPWFEPWRNRLTDHGDEPPPEDDLQARYYLAWDEKYLYLGAECRDNVNDVDDPQPEDKRWYFKDCICWFMEAPHDEVQEQFGQGDNAFCFVIDAGKPSYGAWWRHGAPGENYIEEPIPAGAVDYAIRMDPWGRSEADFILEARVEMAATFGRSDPDWRPPEIGDEYSVEIVHTDPDGGSYGGHFIIYGTGDDDSTWHRLILSGPQSPIERLEE